MVMTLDLESMSPGSIPGRSFLHHSNEVMTKVRYTTLTDHDHVYSTMTHLCCLIASHIDSLERAHWLRCALQSLQVPSADVVYDECDMQRTTIMVRASIDPSLESGSLRYDIAFMCRHVNLTWGPPQTQFQKIRDMTAQLPADCTAVFFLDDDDLISPHCIPTIHSVLDYAQAPFFITCEAMKHGFDHQTFETWADIPSTFSEQFTWPMDFSGLCISKDTLMHFLDYASPIIDQGLGVVDCYLNMWLREPTQSMNEYPIPHQLVFYRTWHNPRTWARR